MNSPTPHPRLAFWTLTITLGLGLWYQTRRLQVIHNRIGELEDQNIDENSLRRALRNELAGVHEELTVIRLDLVAATDEAERAYELADRVNLAENRLGDMGQVMEAQASSLSNLEEAQANFGPEELERQLNERDDRLLRRWESLSELVSTAHRTAAESRQRVALLEHDATRDLQRMWRDLVGPVVQLAGESSVGSGVLLRSIENGDGTFTTYLVTAWHVVRDIQVDLSHKDDPVPVTIYREDGTIYTEEASLLCFNPEIDAALLRLSSNEKVDFGATLAERQRLDDVKIFDEVYAVGCPLGNDPIPTRGEIATDRHDVEGEHYWMINAPTYIGNSGGGIFDSESHDLLGIFSKIYTHGSLRPTIVPHMGLVTPLDAIYDWLEKEGYGVVRSSRGSVQLVSSPNKVAAAGH